MDRLDLMALDKAEMVDFVHRMGWASYRTKQLLQWIYQKGAAELSEMTDISKPDRQQLERVAYLSRLSCVRRLKSDDGTEKFLFRLADGQEVESVLIPGEDKSYGSQTSRWTLCISTQVGCSLDCRFCLTGTMGLLRNLSAHEIVEQVLEVIRLGKRITNIVLMGMGEPLANEEAVIDALHRLTDPSMIGISPRKITLSTSGLVPQIRRLGKAGLGVNIAISLNATTDHVRNQIMPAVNKLYPLKELMSACRDYPLSPRQRLFFEYVLLAGMNDTAEDAKRLVILLKGIRSKVNLIPFNEFSKTPFRRPEDKCVLDFQAILIKAGIITFIRKSRGRDILAACGQLRTNS